MGLEQRNAKVPPAANKRPNETAIKTKIIILITDSKCSVCLVASFNNLMIFFKSSFGIQTPIIEMNDEKFLKLEIQAFLRSSNWNAVGIILDMIYGFFFLGIVFGFVIHFLLLYGIIKTKECFMLPWLIIAIVVLGVSITSIYKRIKYTLS